MIINTIYEKLISGFSGKLTKLTMTKPKCEPISFKFLQKKGGNLFYIVLKNGPDSYFFFDKIFFFTTIKVHKNLVT